VRHWRYGAWLTGILVAGGVLSPPFWSGVRLTALSLLALVFLVVVRELTRLAVGSALGLRAAMIEIGEGPAVARFHTGRLLWIICLKPIVSETIWEPPPADRPLRARLALLAATRPAMTAAILLLLRAARVPLGWSAQGATPVAHALVMMAENLLLIGLIPFTIRGQSMVPFESDGMKLVRLLSRRDGGPPQDLARFYFASVREALHAGDAARAVALCAEGLAKYGPPWTDVLRAYEAVALARGGDHVAAMARAEAQLARDLEPVARAVALNDWSWYAFLQRDDRKLRLADRRSADAMVLKPDSPAVSGTRGAVLLWQGRVAEAAPLIERSSIGAYTPQGRDTNLCLLAMAQAARGDLDRAQASLRAVRRPEQTERLFPEAKRAVQAAAGAEIVLPAARGRRSMAFVRASGRDLIELRGAGAARRLAADDIRRVTIGTTVRGRSQLVFQTDRGAWRLPLAAADLAWARMLLARVHASAVEPPVTVEAAEAAESLETQERAYQESVRPASVSSPRGVLFLASLVAFAAAALVSSSWQWMGALLPILFVHELGHWLAMRAFGHRDAGIAFIPLVGAATTTRTPFRKRWQEVVMLLAGPIPGIVAGIALLVVPATRHLPRLQMVAITAISINALNLLPLHPLDGGRILHLLVTAGRPRLDLAFKTVAAALFAVGGLKAHDPLLGTLGLFGLLFWPQALRAAKLEERIRATPGFDPRLPPNQRRAYVFRVLAREPALKAKSWASTVAGLEGPLAYQKVPVWQIAVGTLSVVVLLGGVFAAGGWWIAHRLAGRRAQIVACPAVDRSRVVSCTDPGAWASLRWDVPGRVPAPAAKPGDDDDDAPALAGFVECAAPDAAAARNLRVELRRILAARRYCAAFPWELPGGAPDATQARARATLQDLDDFWYGGDAAVWEHRIAREKLLPSFDPETARLLRELAITKPEASGHLYAALVARLGAVPGGRCDVTLWNVRGAREDPTDVTVAFAATFNDARELAPLGALLCRAGCRVSVLPAAPEDERIMSCR
jgi:Zn-dependent protease